MKKKLIFLFALACCAIVFTACHKDEEEEPIPINNEGKDGIDGVTSHNKGVSYYGNWSYSGKRYNDMDGQNGLDGKDGIDGKDGKDNGNGNGGNEQPNNQDGSSITLIFYESRLELYLYPFPQSLFFEVLNIAADIREELSCTLQCYKMGYSEDVIIYGILDTDYTFTYNNRYGNKHKHSMTVHFKGKKMIYDKYLNTIALTIKVDQIDIDGEKKMTDVGELTINAAMKTRE